MLREDRKKGLKVGKAVGEENNHVIQYVWKLGWLTLFSNGAHVLTTKPVLGECIASWSA